MTRKRVQAIDFKAGKPTRYQAFDVHDFEVAKDASKRQMTREGFMIAPANISRTGIQEYTARELGLEGTNRTIRLYRPPEEVFKPASYGTFERQTITNSHPDGEVTASTYRAVTSGDVHDVAPAGDDVNLAANLYVKDANTIEMVVTYEKNQLSCGYSFVLDMTAGVTPDGQAYDGVMRDIVGNHVAIVWQARGGPGLRVADHIKKRNRPMKTITINGITCEVSDETPESSITTLNREIKTLTDAKDTAVTQAKADAAALKAATDASAAAKTAHDAALVEANGKIVTQTAVDALVDEKIKAIAGAKAIVGDAFDGKGKTVEAIRLEVIAHVAKDEVSFPGVLAVLDGVDLSKAEPAIVKAAFGAAVAVKAAGGERRGTDSATARAFAPDPKVKDGGGASGEGRTIKYRTDKVGFGPKAGRA